MQYSDETQQQMFSMIESWQQSSLTQKAWCEQHSIPYHVFHYWYKKYKDIQLSENKKTGFIALQVKPPSSAAPIIAPAGVHTEIALPDGRRLLFHQPVSADYLKALIS
jgi:hypothetical protein